MISISSPILMDLSDVLQKIHSENKPVLFFDACSMLDILRIALPERNIAEGVDKQIVDIKNLIVNEDIICISSQLCIKEFNDHCTAIITSFEPQLKKIQEPVNKYLKIVNNSGMFGVLPVIDLNSYTMENYFQDIAKAVTDKIIFIKEQDTFKDAAHVRVVNKMCPAKKKGEYKDCFIWETFLQTIKGKSNQTEEAYFLSSNKEDYCSLPDISDFHPDLKAEIISLNISFSLSFTRLFHRFKTAGLI